MRDPFLNFIAINRFYKKTVRYLFSLPRSFDLNPSPLLFFRVCARLLQRAPIPFLECAALPPIIQCALMACSLDHKEANTSVMKFFYDLIGAGNSRKTQPDFQRRSALVKAILDENGQNLTANLLHACVFSLPSHMLSEVSDVIVELLHTNRDATGRWLRSAVDSLPTHCNGVIIAATADQLNDFYVSITR